MKIEKDIPLPEGNIQGNRFSKHRIVAREMNVGDSVGDLNERERNLLSQALRVEYGKTERVRIGETNFRRYITKSLNKVFVSRKQSDGKYRVWRIEEKIDGQ